MIGRLLGVGLLSGGLVSGQPTVTVIDNMGYWKDQTANIGDIFAYRDQSQQILANEGPPSEKGLLNTYASKVGSGTNNIRNGMSGLVGGSTRCEEQSYTDST